MKTFSAHAITALALTLGSSGVHAIELTALPGLTTSSSTNYVYSSSNGPKGNIIDGNFDTYWNAGAYTGWVQVDFGATYVLDRVELYGNSPSYVDQYQLLTSDNGSAWNVIASGAYHSEAALTGVRKFGGLHDFTGGVEPVGRYLRYAASTPTVWAYLGELKVNGHVPTATPVPELTSQALLLGGLLALGAVARRRATCRR